MVQIVVSPSYPHGYLLDKKKTSNLTYDDFYEFPASLAIPRERNKTFIGNKPEGNKS